MILLAFLTQSAFPGLWALLGVSSGVAGAKLYLPFPAGLIFKTLSCVGVHVVFVFLSDTSRKLPEP